MLGVNCGEKCSMAKQHISLLLAGWGLLFVVHLLVFFHFGAQFVDDAYITFRYAERIASGKGFTFNDGQWVLGTTTPLWTLLIAFGRVLHIPLAIWVGILSSICAGTVAFFLWRIMADLGASALGYVAGIALLIYERWLFDFLMGMEVLLYVALVFGLFLSIIKRKWQFIGYLGALAILCRPDGVVIAAIAIMACWLSDRRQALRQAGILLLVLFPWLLFSLFRFHSVFPQSISAKQWIHPASFSEAMLGPWKLLLDDPFLGSIFILAGIGIVGIIVKWRHCWTILAWLLLFSLGLGASRIKTALFPWYSAPLIAVIYVLAIIGLCALSHLLARMYALLHPDISLRAFCRALPIIILVLLCLRHSNFWQRNWRHFPPLTRKEEQYLLTARQLRPLIKPHDKVLVGEVGVFSYVLDQAEIIDSAGINSPVVEAIRRRHAKDEQSWVKDCIAAFSPQWIISLPHFLGLENMIRNQSLPPQYKIVSGLPLSPGGVVILQRKNEP